MSDIKLIQGDCLEKMKEIPDNSIDCVFTDPPYKLVGGGRKNSLLRNYNNCSPFSTSGECFNVKTPNFDKWVPELFRVIKDNCYLFIMVNDRNLKKLWECLENNKFTFCEILVMNKLYGVPYLYFFKSCEYILMFRKGKYKNLNKYGIKNVFNVKMPSVHNKKIHPTQKPVECISQIIKCVTNQGEIILDCFMGSGLTGVACVNTNRNFIGIELDENYFNIAKNRIDECVRLFKQE